jgi:FecR protein
MLKVVVYAAVLLFSFPVVLMSPSLAGAESVKAGVVTTLEGNVTVTRVTVPPQPLKFRDDVFVNDTVTTGERSIARMLLGGKAVVTVRERSALTITEIPGKATIDLAAGKIALAVAKDKMRPGESIEIRAANAVAGIRGTVVVAEVSTASAQSGDAGGAVGTFWVLTGKVEAYLANQPGRTAVVDALQQFRGGAVTNIQPGQMAQILQGLSTGKVPRTTDQAPESAYSAGLALAGSAAVVGSAVGAIVPPAVIRPTVPILPGNQTISAPKAPETPVVVMPPPPPPPSKCDSGRKCR